MANCFSSHKYQVTNIFSKLTKVLSQKCAHLQNRPHIFSPPHTAVFNFSNKPSLSHIKFHNQINPLLQSFNQFFKLYKTNSFDI